MSLWRIIQDDTRLSGPAPEIPSRPWRAPIRRNGLAMIPHEAFTHAHLMEVCLALPVGLGTVDQDDRLDPTSERFLPENSQRSETS